MLHPYSPDTKLCFIINYTSYTITWSSAVYHKKHLCSLQTCASISYVNSSVILKNCVIHSFRHLSRLGKAILCKLVTQAEERSSYRLHLFSLFPVAPFGLKLFTNVEKATHCSLNRI